MRGIAVDIGLEAEDIDGLCFALERLIAALRRYDEGDKHYDFEDYDNDNDLGYTISVSLSESA